VLLKHVRIPSAFSVYPANIEWVARYLRVDKYDIPCFISKCSTENAEFYVVSSVSIFVLKFIHKQEASGRTYAQITVQTGREGETVWGSIEAPNYFYTLIRGRGPGKIPANLGQIIMEWAKLKGITFSDPKDLVRFGNATAWKIKREGSELYRNHIYVDLVDTPSDNFEEYLSQHLDKMMKVLIEESFTPDNNMDHGYII
jgi:hypothetical protein